LDLETAVLVDIYQSPLEIQFQELEVKLPWLVEQVLHQVVMLLFDRQMLLKVQASLF